jgi:hypothetical protein
MSKKLIAVASAAALALSALVGVAPAHASASAAFGTGITGAGATSATAATVPMPVANILSSSTSGNLDLVLTTGDVVRVETTGGVRVIETISGLGASANASVNVSKLGVTSWTKTYSTTDGTETIIAYALSTTAGSIAVTITRTGLTYTNTLYLKGATAASEYNVTDVTGIPATLAKGASADITFKVTDSLGNAVEDDTEVENVARVKVDGANIATAPTWDAAAKVYKAKITSPSSSAFIVSLSSGASDIVGYPDAVSSTSVVNGTGVASQITALTAQVTALTADYNALAKKWNKRVASKTAPKKKVVLK